MSNLELIRDFVNTADLEGGEDRLADARGLQYWLLFHGLAELHDRASDVDVATALDVRESLRELLRAHNERPRCQPAAEHDETCAVSSDQIA